MHHPPIRVQPPRNPSRPALLSEWSTLEARPLSRESFSDLLDARIPAIVLPRFIDGSECLRLISNLQASGMSNYSHVNHPVERLGMALMEYHLKGSPAEYFARVSSARETYLQAVAGISEDPISRLARGIGESSGRPVEIAREVATGRPYHAGTFRNVKSRGNLHFDFAPLESPGWEIGKALHQLTWNLYLNRPVGGTLRVYAREYQPSDERLRVPGQYFYNHQVVSKAGFFEYSPVPGEVVLFNSRNFHEIDPVEGNRYTLSSFISEMPDGRLLLWS
jgi:hypothetical protein